MIGRVPRWPLLVGIVIAASACDNVSWGGMEMGLRGPGADSTPPSPDSGQVQEAEEPVRELGPLLYAGIRDGNMARIIPVGELTEGGLVSIPPGPQGEETLAEILSQRLRPGKAMDLFHQGVRVGTLEIEESEVGDGSYCGRRIQALGHLQLTPEAAEAQHFLALGGAEPDLRGFAPFETLASTYDQRVASINMGAEAIPLVGASWPPSLLDTRQDLQVFRLPGSEAPAVMATFVYKDRLQVGPAPDDAYALMIMGEPRRETFNLVYTWYRNVGESGKGTPRYFSRLDWDGDGDQEILLEVMGESTRWFATIDRGPEGWVTTYEDPCGRPRDPGA